MSRGHLELLISYSFGNNSSGIYICCTPRRWGSSFWRSGFGILDLWTDFCGQGFGFHVHTRLQTVLHANKSADTHISWQTDIKGPDLPWKTRWKIYQSLCFFLCCSLSLRFSREAGFEISPTTHIPYTYRKWMEYVWRPETKKKPESRENRS